MSKLSIIVLSEDEHLLDLKRSTFASILQVENTIQVIGLPGAGKSVDSYYTQGLFGPQLLETIKWLQTDGSDAIIIDHIRDPLLSAARQVSGIPVLGIGQTAFRLTCLLADNYSVITTSTGNSLAVEHNTQEYQLSKKLVSTHSLEMPVTPNGLDQLNETFLLAAIAALEKNGAHALIVDSGGLAGIASMIQQELSARGIQIPVIDPTQAAIKLAEILVNMELSHSKRSYPYPPSLEVPGYTFAKPIVCEEIAGKFELIAEIEVIVPSSEKDVDMVMEKVYSTYCSPGVKVTAVNLDKGPYSIESEYDDALAAPQIYEKIIKAEEAGKDAVLIDCMFDVGLLGGREIANILFLGPGITSMQIGSILSDKISVITVLNQSIPEIERQICRYDLVDHSSPVRAVELHVLEVREESYTERLIDEFINETVQAIEEDNAHFIIPGCTGMVGLQKRVSAAAERYEVPVLDQNMILVKVCEMFLSLGLTHSKKSYPHLDK